MQYSRSDLYDRMFTSRTSDVIRCLTVGEFREYLKKFCECKIREEYIDGYIIWCQSYTLEEDNGMQKIFLVDESGRVFLKISAVTKIQFLDDELPMGISSGLKEGDLFRLPNSIWRVDKLYETDNKDLYYKNRMKISVVCRDHLFAGRYTMDVGYGKEQV